MQDLVLLQTFIGLSVAAGVAAGGSVINRTCSISYRKYQISMQYLCQGSLSLVSVSLLTLGLVTEYRNLCLLAWTYGLGLGSFRYSMKMLALERIRAKHFTKAWGFIKTAEALPVLFGIPLVSFLNEASRSEDTTANGQQAQHIMHHSRAGYFVCSAATGISAVLLFFIGHPERRYNRAAPPPAVTDNNSGSMISHCNGAAIGSACPDLLNRSFHPSAVTGTSPWNPVGGYSSSIYPGQQQQHNPLQIQPHQQQQQLPPAYHHNPATAEPLLLCHRINGLSATATPQHHHPPRLQKSLSFAFQTPPTSIMWNEQDHRHHYYHNPHKQQHQQQPHHHPNGRTTPCLYSRCSSR